MVNTLPEISTAAPRKTRGLSLAVVFTASIFLSASLLFSVQPMFSKLILPLLGGSSNVWNTAMVFFQAVLLGGYIYAHLISKYLPLKGQVAVHLGVTALGFLFLPLTIAAGWTPPESGVPTFWLLGLFGVSVGVPFFAISANAPLFQRWFSHTSHKDADDPYFLYAASNAGSLLTICAYPLLIEPNLRLAEQTSGWSIGYMALFAAILICGAVMVMNRREGESSEAVVHDEATKKSFKTIVYWVFLAFIPSSLMLGLTSYMTNNIASAPFLWILPLSLFLLTFVIVFAKNSWATSARLAPLFPWVVLVALGAVLIKELTPAIAISVSLICYFLIALFCHARLVELRPAASGLTSFYIFMSVGGVLGGVFNALIAPIFFNDIYEFLLVLWVAGFIRGQGEASHALTQRHWRDVGLFGLIAIATFWIGDRVGVSGIMLVAIVAAIVFLISTKIESSVKGKIFYAFFLVGFVAMQPFFSSKTIFKDRSFFSLLKVQTNVENGLTTHRLIHGDTIHNFQLRGEDLETIPLAYYARTNTFDDMIKAKRAVTPELTISAIGLGAGALACHEEAGDSWTYFEIDPAVVEMARNPKYFSYLERCAPNADIRTGDARLTISSVPERSQDIIIVDAFTSDTIPAHLVTKEALAIYKSRLKDDGVIFFHTSSRMMDVSSVVFRIAEESGLGRRYINRKDFADHPYADYVTASTGVVVGAPAVIDALYGSREYWTDYAVSPSVGVWTDDYSSVLGTLKSHYFKEGQPVIATSKSP